jgi:uncharacterized membrane protein
MQIGNRSVLLVIVFAAIVLLAVISWTTGCFRIILSIIFLLFSPGYTFLAAVFPSNSSMGPVERIALSFGVSLAMIPVIGLLLHFSWLHLELNPVLITTAVLIFIMSAIAWYRDIRLAPENRLSIRFPKFIPIYLKLKKLDKALTIILVAFLLIFIGVLAFAVAVPDKGEDFTEFYILDAQGTTIDYPEKISYGDSISLIVGVISHEEEDTNYRVEIENNGKLISTLETGSLIQNEKWEEQATFQPPEPGNGQKMEFWLYRQNEVKPYNRNPLSITIQVTE